MSEPASPPTPAAAEPAAGQTSPAPRGRGRPRSAAHDDAILDAAVTLMREVGYSRLTMEGVAAAAGITNAALTSRLQSSRRI